VVDGINKNHGNWHSTNKNEFTVGYILWVKNFVNWQDKKKSCDFGFFSEL
jgi:hypothetical protein